MACYSIQCSLLHLSLIITIINITPFVHFIQSSSVPFTTSSLINKSHQLLLQQQAHHSDKSITSHLHPHHFNPTLHQHHDKQLPVTNDVTTHGQRFRRDSSSPLDDVNTTATNANIDTNDLSNLSTGEGEIKTESSLGDANGNYYDYTASLLEASPSPESLSDAGKGFKLNPNSGRKQLLCISICLCVKGYISLFVLLYIWPSKLN